MKVMYVGGYDELAQSFIERMNKEGHDVYLLSDNKFSGKFSKVLKYKYYKLSGRTNMTEIVFSSVLPEVVVFAGINYMNVLRSGSKEKYLITLDDILEQCAKYKVKKFIYLSSHEVYGHQFGIISEENKVMPDTSKGRICAEGEYMTSLYKEKYGFQSMVLRGTEVYSENCSDKGKDFLSSLIRDLKLQSKINIEEDEFLQPIHVSDYVDAIKRVMESGDDGIYNVSGDFTISKGELLHLLCESFNIEADIKSEANAKVRNISNENIHKKLEWTDFRNLKNLIKEKKIVYAEDKIKVSNKENKKLPPAIRRTIENIIVFIIFFLLYYFSNSHTLFSKVHWLLIYVVLISLFIGIRQSALSVILASCGYLFMQDVSIFEMTNFYSYGEAVLMIVEFVFFGICTSYTSDMLKENLQESQRNLKLLNSEYEELKEINKENVAIKMEYEKRILDSKSGLPKLYSVVNKLMVLQPERIFMEILNVISEMINTKTVAVYKVNGNSPYLRLVNALNEESIISGKSWNLENYPKIKGAIQKGELYHGNVLNKEPAAVVPIYYEGKSIAVILIKALEFESQTLHHVNLLRTLTLLITESVVRAIEYENYTRGQRCVKNTEILNSKEFKGIVLLAQEKKDKQLAEYCIIKLDNFTAVQDIYERALVCVRMTDYFGIDEEEVVYVLLNNTSEEDCEIVLKRLEEKGVKAELVRNYEGIGE
ncbi:NAD(P)-dependent oxidoreductase [Clostridium sp.]|uniref:NAD-dependent epimerase/dehydratase family protein n=1 Tax=Clostridium sp. TaxID=1506 RepID=UPI002FC9FEAA